MGPSPVRCAVRCPHMSSHRKDALRHLLILQGCLHLSAEALPVPFKAPRLDQRSCFWPQTSQIQHEHAVFSSFPNESNASKSLSGSHILRLPHWTHLVLCLPHLESKARKAHETALVPVTHNSFRLKRKPLVCCTSCPQAWR